MDNIGTPEQNRIYENNGEYFVAPRADEAVEFNTSDIYNTFNTSIPTSSTPADKGLFDIYSPLEIFFIFIVLLFLIHLMALISIIQLNSKFGRFLDLYRESKNNTYTESNTILSPKQEANETDNSKTENYEEVRTVKDQLKQVNKKLLLTLFLISSIWIIIIVFLYLNN